MQEVLTDYRFGRFVIDLRRGALFADGTERPLRPKSFALLRHLAGRAGQLVGRDEIMEAVWPGTYVTEDSITQCIRDIRRALGDDDAHILRTLPRRGYLLAAVEPAAPESVPGSMAVPDPLPAPPTDRPVVLVLPFENIGGDPEQGYFADGRAPTLSRTLRASRSCKSPLRHGLIPFPTACLAARATSSAAACGGPAGASVSRCN